MDETAVSLDPAAVLWGADRAAGPLLVLLHGYGADERDLFGLVPSLPDGFAVAAVRAPLAPPWPAPGYSWYPIEDVLDGQTAGRGPSRVTDAASALLVWLDAVAEGRPVGLLGFSQGASVAIQALRLRPERFAFAVNLSGYASPGELPADPALAARGVPVFWGRGALDEVIPAPLIVHTTQWLPAHSTLSGRVYPDLGHAVSSDELADVRAFLDKRLEELGAVQA